MPIRSSSYATSSTSELVVSVQLPLNTMFFCHVEVLSHVFFRHHSASMQPLYTALPAGPIPLENPPRINESARNKELPAGHIIPANSPLMPKQPNYIFYM